MSRIEKIWEIAPVDHARVSLLAAELNLPEPLAAILLSRGVENRAQAERFFSPSLTDLPSPFLMKGMTEAVEVVLQALARQAPDDADAAPPFGFTVRVAALAMERRIENVLRLPLVPLDGKYEGELRQSLIAAGALTGAW